MESGQPEVALLTALLQTRNEHARLEIYQRELAPAPPSVRDAFARLVGETKLAVETSTMRGEAADPQLLQQLRIIELEVAERIGQRG